MIERRAEQRAALESARELPRELFHASNCGHLRHVLAQHVEIFQQHRALVIQRWLKWLATMDRIFNLPKDPRIRHRAAADQNSVAARFAKTIERLLNPGNVATPRNWDLH